MERGEDDVGRKAKISLFFPQSSEIEDMNIGSLPCTYKRPGNESRISRRRRRRRTPTMNLELDSGWLKRYTTLMFGSVPSLGLN